MKHIEHINNDENKRTKSGACNDCEEWQCWLCDNENDPDHNMCKNGEKPQCGAIEHNCTNAGEGFCKREPDKCKDCDEWQCWTCDNEK